MQGSLIRAKLRVYLVIPIFLRSTTPLVKFQPNPTLSRPHGVLQVCNLFSPDNSRLGQEKKPSRLHTVL